MLLCIRLPNFIQIGHLRRSNYVVSFFKMAGATAQYYLLLLRFVFVDVAVLESRNLSENQISSTYLNPRPRYNYFRFGQTNVRHWYLMPVWISAISPSACYSASACQISSKWDHPRWKYDVISLFKMAAVNHVEFALG